MKRSIAWLVAFGVICAMGAQGAIIFTDSFDGSQDGWTDGWYGLNDPSPTWGTSGGLGAQILQSSDGDGGPGGALELLYTSDTDATGDWSAMGQNGIQQITLDFYTEPGIGAPGSLDLYFEDGSGNEWFYNLDSQVSDGWDTLSAALLYGAGWYAPGLGGGTEAQFLAAIQDVAQVGILLGYVGGIDDQEYGLDNFTLDDAVNTPEPGTFLFLGVAFASMGMSFRKKLREMLASVLKK
jgi:hypothetical protein